MTPLSPLSSTAPPIAQWTKAWAVNRGLKVQFENETPSTNALAKNDDDSLTKPELGGQDSISAPTVYLAEKQTAGRGRGKNSWTSATGSLLGTWSYALTFPPQPILSPLIGLALFDAASTAFPGVLFNLKAPNDLYIEDKKVAGLLVESVVIGESVTCAVGLGFNVWQAPTELIEKATSLKSRLSGEFTRQAWEHFLNLWLEKLDLAVRDSRSESLRVEARTRLVNALNSHPLLKEPILVIDEQGQMLTPSRKIFWHEL